MFCSIAAILIGWWHDHSRLLSQLDRAQIESRHTDTEADIDEFSALLDAIHIGGGLKPDYWRPSDYLRTNTTSLEHELALSDVEGDLVTSLGFGGDVELRQPTEETFREVAAYLKSKSSLERARAAKLLALYGEAYRATPVSPYEDYVFAKHGRYSWATEPVPILRELLDDPYSQVRQGAALALAHFGTSQNATRKLSGAFARESDDTTRLYIAWSLDRLIRPRPGRVRQAIRTSQ